MSEINLHRQIAQHLENWKAAGLDWLPGTLPQLELALPQVQPAAEPTPVVNPKMARMIELKLLAETVAKCDRCPELVSTRTQTVFGVGPLDPKLLFLGEAPGQDEDLKGEPFVGAAGQQLNKIIAAIGLKRDDIFICNILRCRPPGNREPKPEEADCCREYLDKTIDLVQPTTIVCWGGVASKNLLKTSQGVTRLRGKKYEYRGIPVFVTLHPASLLYEGGADKKRMVWEDMKMLLAHLGLPIPGKPATNN